jgi:hypothetical protein
MRRGYDQGIQYTKDFASTVDRIVGGTIMGGSGSGAEVGSNFAQQLVSGMRSGLESSRSALRESLERGLISPKEYRAQGQAAALEYNKGLLNGLSELRSRGLLSDDMRNSIIGQMEDVGASGGRSFAQTLTATIHRHRALIPTLGGLLLGQALGAAGDVAGANNGLDKAVETGKAAEKILENVAMLASFVLDPIPGLITAVVGGSAAAIVKIWTNAKEETAKARQDFTNELIGAARGQDFGDLAKLRQKAYSGDPFADVEGQRKGESEAAFTARKLGIDGINRAVGDLNRQIAAMPPTILVPTRTGRQAVNNPAIDDAREKIKKLSDAMMIAGEQAARLDPVMSNVLGKSTPTKTEVQGFNVAQMRDNVELVTSAWQRQKDEGIEPAAALVDNMIAAHARINELLGNETDQSSKTAVQLRNSADAIDRIMRSYTQLSTVRPGSVQLDVLLGSASLPSETATRMGALGVGQQGNSLADQRSIMGSLLNYRQAIREEVEREGGATKANIQLLQIQQDIEAKILAQRTLLAPPKPLPSAFSGITAAVARSTDLTNLADAAKSVGASNAGELEKQANAERQKAIGLIRGMLEATDAETLSTKEGRQAVEELLQLLTQLGDITGKGASNFEGMKNAIRGVFDAAGGFGVMGREIRQAGNDVLHVIDSIQALQKAREAAEKTGGMKGGLATIGAGLGVVGGIIGAVGTIASLFGKSQAAQERDQTLRENNERLRELKLSLDGTLNSASANTRLSAGLGTLTGDLSHVPQGASGGTLEMLGYLKQFDRDTKALGKTWDELQQKAKDLGINLFDSKGNIIVKAFDQLAQALQLEAKKLAAFTKSFDDQNALRELHNKVFGTTAPADQFNSTLALLKKFAPELAANLEGIDATTAEGRKQIEAALQGLVTQLEQGTLTLEQLGDLEGAKQLADIISMLQESLDGMNDAVNTVTGSLLGIPDWYKIADARYRAADPMAPPTMPNVGGGTGQSFIPHTSGPTGPGVSSAVIIQGDVYVDAQKEPAEKVAASFLRVMQRKAAVQLGDSTRWSEVQV